MRGMIQNNQFRWMPEPAMRKNAIATKIKPAIAA
jgi:hypothetical protein